MRKLGWAVAGAVVCGAPLLGGSADRPYTLGVAAAAAVAAMLVAIDWRRRAALAGPTAPVSASWFTVWLAVAVGATLLQTLPLPPGLRRWLAPGSQDQLTQLADWLGRPPIWPLSLDAAATATEAVRLAGYLCLLIVFGDWVAGDSPRRRTGWPLAAGPLLFIVAAAGLCGSLGILSWLGLPLPTPLAVPSGGVSRALFPAGFYNSNHLAALVGLGALLSLSLAQRARSSSLLVPTCVVCNLVLVGSLSRAGMATWLMAQVLLLVGRRWLGPQSAAGRRQLGWLLLPGLALPLGLLLSPSLGPQLGQRIASTTAEQLLAPGGKVNAWLELGPLLRGHWLLGCGRGAFENAFQHTQSLAGQLRFVYLENEWLQTVVDWGIPLATLLFGLLLLALHGSWQSLRRAVPAVAGAPSGRLLDGRVALLGLAALGVHNCFDFNLEVGGVAVAALALAALCEQPRFCLRRRWAASLLLALGLCTGVAALLVASYLPSHDEEGAALRTLAADPGCSSAQLMAAGRAAAVRHPFDSYLLSVVAARLQAADDPEAVTWVNRALAANPRDVLARHTGAALLQQHGYGEQARLLLRAALGDADRAQRQPLLHSLVAWTSDADQLLATVPDDEVLGELLDLLGSLASPRWAPLQALARRAVGRRIGVAALWLGRSTLALHDGARAATALQALLDAGPTVPALLFGDLAELLATAGQPELAEQLVGRALARQAGAEPAELLLTLAGLHERRGAVDAARQLLDRAQQVSAGRAEQTALLARVEELYGDLEAQAGNLHRAAAHRLQAAQLRQQQSP